MTSRRSPRWPALVVTLLSAVVGAITLLVTSVAWSAPASALDRRAGDAVVVAATDHSKELSGGDSSTEFSLRLPDGASCPGDSANDDYRIDSFLVPAADDPGSLTYSSIGPAGPGQIALYRTDTNQFVSALTQMNDRPDQPGLIPEVPALTFSVYGPGDVAAGSDRLGISCTLGPETIRYWDVPIELTVDPSSSSTPIRWTVTNPPASSSNGTGPAMWLGLVALGACVVGATFFLRRRSAPATSRKEIR